MSKISTDELVRQNPRVDPEKVRKVNELLESMRAAGVDETPKYGLATPYARRPKGQASYHPRTRRI
jgi:hypothetical protein